MVIGSSQYCNTNTTILHLLQYYKLQYYNTAILKYFNTAILQLLQRLRYADGELSATGDGRVRVSRCLHQESGGKVSTVFSLTLLTPDIRGGWGLKVPKKYKKNFTPPWSGVRVNVVWST